MLPCKIHNYVLLGKHYIPSHDVRSSEEVLRKFCGSMWPLCAADDQQAEVKLQKAASSNLFVFGFLKISITTDSSKVYSMEKYAFGH